MIKLKYKLLSVLLLALLFLPALSVRAQTPPSCESAGSAQAIERCSEAYVKDEIERRCTQTSTTANDACAENIRRSISSGDYDFDNTPDATETNYDANCEEGVTADKCGIVAYLVAFINVLSALVGIVIIIMVVIGGIQYSAARDNPQAVAAARGKIINALTALLLYVFGFAILQWLIPGGLF